MILMLSMFFIVRANVRTERTTMTRVKKNPQQLDVYGSAVSMGLAPKISKNLIVSLAQCKILSFKEENLDCLTF